MVPQPLLAVLGGDRLQAFEKGAAHPVHACRDGPIDRQRPGNLQHMLQRLMLVPKGPVGDPLEYLAKYLAGQVCQQQGAHGRHEQARQVEQHLPRTLERTQAFGSSRGIRLRRGHGKKPGIGLDPLHVRSRLPGERIARPCDPSWFKVGLGVQQALAQQQLVAHALVKGNACAEGALQRWVSHGQGQCVVCRLPIGKAAQRLLRIVRQIQQHPQQLPRVEDQATETGRRATQFECHGPVYPAPQQPQGAHLQALIPWQLRAFAPGNLAQHAQVTVRQLPLDGRHLDGHGQLPALVLRQPALEIAVQYLRQVLLIGLADVLGAAQADDLVDTPGDGLFASGCPFCADQRCALEKRFASLEVLQQFLQGRRGYPVGLELTHVALHYFQAPALFAPQRPGQVDMQTHAALQRLLKALHGKTFKGQQLLRNGGNPLLALPMVGQAGAQSLNLRAPGVLQPGGQLCTDKITRRVQQFGV
ncbi:hypothetical protein D3C80_885600 [compost metagenome]